MERAVWAEGKPYVAGVDEAGRGPLAGAVVAAAVILPEGFDGTGITDSKKLTEKQREKAFERIQQGAIAFCIAEASPAEIDSINILRATHLAMKRAVEGLSLPPSVVFVDGLPVRGLHTDCRNFIKGDSRSLCIAAASILAKVTRDRQMVEAETLWPGYGFAGHKGYPSPAHLRALVELGPCPIHRRSFGPVAQLGLEL
ncbi:MAG: ribonuclease HII [Armatimonas sp.]